ncbi:MAG: hypothetical protein AAFN10_06610 [Bacteroidota bacterium]
MEELLEEIKDVKLHSSTAILIATLFGGPLAAGYLMMENYQNLGDRDAASKALIYGIVGTVALFGLILLIPESVMEVIPTPAISIASVIGIRAIVEQKLGETLKEHKANDKAFYSRWRALAVGLICLLIISAVTLSAVFLFIGIE